MTVNCWEPILYKRRILLPKFSLDAVYLDVIGYKNMIKSNTYLEEEDLEKLLTASVHCHPSQRFVFNTVLQMLWDSGARISELLNLKIRDFNPKQKLVVFKNTKNKEDRMIPITTDITESLLKLIGGRREGFIFRGRDDRAMNRMTFYKALQRRVVASRLDKRITPHSFRHHWITSKIDKGIALPKIQKFVGHSSLAVTGMYYHFAQEDMRKVLEA